MNKGTIWDSFAGSVEFAWFTIRLDYVVLFVMGFCDGLVGLLFILGFLTTTLADLTLFGPWLLNSNLVVEVTAIPHLEPFTGRTILAQSHLCGIFICVF
jgi:hypothetical protein